MLINALCDYYDVLAQMGEVLPEGYSNVKVHYQVCLTSDGKIERILDCQQEVVIGKDSKKPKIKWQPQIVKMPLRSEKPGIDANIIEQRPLYLFGLNFADDKLTPEDRTGKARKSHEDFVKKNLEFLENLDSPVVNAYREFIRNWIPEKETENPYLLQLNKSYSSSGYVFYLSGHPETLLHEDEQVNRHWMELQEAIEKTDAKISQCAITGERLPIARIHGKIKGMPGGLATGTVLVGFNNPSENSYGNEQSYNSNISESVMKKYTEALNYLLSHENHRTILDDITLLHWSVDKNSENDAFMAALLFGNASGWDKERTDKVLESLMKKAREGLVSFKDLQIDKINPDVEFYILGLKPNSSRVSVKFLYRKKFGDILYHIAEHQNDMQITTDGNPVSTFRIMHELVSPKSKDAKVPPALFAQMMESILYGKTYPEYLLTTIVQRVKTDTDVPFHAVRAGIIKACINRKNRLRGKKEEIGMALDKECTNEAYLCGRLFATLEQLQQSASSGNLNRTIKDAYFASAASKPALVFPKLIMLAQNHLKKLSGAEGYKGVRYSMLIGEIIDKLGTEFPEILSTREQGTFMIGYYQQIQSFYTKKTDDVKREEEV